MEALGSAMDKMVENKPLRRHGNRNLEHTKLEREWTAKIKGNTLIMLASAFTTALASYR